MKSYIRALLFYPILLFCGSSAKAEDQNIASSLAWLDHADVNKDLTVALASQDCRFRTLSGLGIRVPGVKDTTLIQAYGLNPIEGAADGVAGYEHARLAKLAREYAENYNIALSEKISEGILCKTIDGTQRSTK